MPFEESDKKQVNLKIMSKGRLYMNVLKLKIIRIYKFLYNEELVNAHCALWIQKNCFKCWY
jgi:hypothetical protein